MRWRNKRAGFGLRGWLVVLAVLVLAGLALSLKGWQWGALKRAVKAKYPGVETMTVKDLADWQATPSDPQPLLLDVREEKEFAVSHIATARRVEPGATVAEAGLLDLPRDQAIITYCSVGYRSGAFAEKLKEAGFTRVWNLDGSIFEWVNSGRKVVRDGKEVGEVHPYDRTWGRFLSKEYRSKL